MMTKPACRAAARGMSLSVLLGLLGLCGCAANKPPAPPPVVASPPTPISTTTCFLLDVYNPSTRQYDKQKICSESAP